MPLPPEGGSADRKTTCISAFSSAGSLLKNPPTEAKLSASGPVARVRYCHPARNAPPAVTWLRAVTGCEQAYCGR